MARVRGALLTCGLMGLVAGLCASPASAVVTFGSTLPEPTPFSYDSCALTCTAVIAELPGAQVTAPVSGTIVRFRLRTGAGSDAQTIKFRVLRSSDGVNFTGAGTSPGFAIPTSAATTEFQVNMPVQKGDYIGIDEPEGNRRAAIVAKNPNAFQAGFFPALADGGAARASGNAKGTDPTLYDVLLQADIEPAAQPGPSPTPTPAPTATQPNCTNSKLVATCADPYGGPSMCGPVTAGFPQCSLPFTLPTACSGAGTGLPVCNLPGNYIVACGGFGLGLAVCNLPPLSVPQVCGPTTAGLPPCAPANTQVLACGPTSVGLPACNFKTFIKAPKPIDISSGELDLDVSCPDGAEGAAAGSARASAEASGSCDLYVDLEALVDAKKGRLIGEADGRCLAGYLGHHYDDDEFNAPAQLGRPLREPHQLQLPRARGDPRIPQVDALQILGRHVRAGRQRGRAEDPQGLPVADCAAVPGTERRSVPGPDEALAERRGSATGPPDRGRGRRGGQRDLRVAGAAQEEGVEGERRGDAETACGPEREPEAAAAQDVQGAARQGRNTHTPSASAQDDR